MQGSGAGSSASYFTVKAALFFDGVLVGDQQGRDAVVHIVVSQFGRWAVNTVNPNWLIETEGTGEIDIRVAHFATPGLSYNPAVDWLGISGGVNETPKNQRTWFRVEPA